MNKKMVKVFATALTGILVAGLGLLTTPASAAKTTINYFTFKNATNTQVHTLGGQYDHPTEVGKASCMTNITSSIEAVKVKNFTMQVEISTQSDD